MGTTHRDSFAQRRVGALIHTESSGNVHIPFPPFFRVSGKTS
jgi:hypothetical protein